MPNCSAASNSLCIPEDMPSPNSHSSSQASNTRIPILVPASRSSTELSSKNCRYIKWTAIGTAPVPSHTGRHSVPFGCFPAHPPRMGMRYIPASFLTLFPLLSRYGLYNGPGQVDRPLCRINCSHHIGSGPCIQSKLSGNPRDFSGRQH